QSRTCWARAFMARRVLAWRCGSLRTSWARVDRCATRVAFQPLRPEFLYLFVRARGPRARIRQHGRRRDVLVRTDELIARPDPFLHPPPVRRPDVDVLVLAHQIDRRLSALLFDGDAHHVRRPARGAVGEADDDRRRVEVAVAAFLRLPRLRRRPAPLATLVVLVRRAPRGPGRAARR